MITIEMRHIIIDIITIIIILTILIINNHHTHHHRSHHRHHHHHPFIPDSVTDRREDFKVELVNNNQPYKE
jgi:hypothetical protein